MYEFFVGSAVLFVSIGLANFVALEHSVNIDN